MKQFSESLMNTIKNQNQQLISDLNTHTFERVKYTQIFESPSPQAIEAKAVNFSKVKNSIYDIEREDGEYIKIYNFIMTQIFILKLIASKILLKRTKEQIAKKSKLKSLYKIINSFDL